MIALPRSFIRTTPGPVDSRGLILFHFDRWLDGKKIDSATVVSGQPGAQTLRKAADAPVGAYEPIGEGCYSLGDPDAKFGLNVAPGGGSWGAGLGDKWVGIHPLPGYGPERAEGIHDDDNRATSPGTAACEGANSEEDDAKIFSWFQGADRPTMLVVDYNFGTVPVPAPAIPQAHLKVFRKPAAFAAFQAGAAKPNGRLELTWAPGSFSAVLDGLPLAVDTLDLDLLYNLAAPAKNGSATVPAPAAKPAGETLVDWLSSADSPISVAVGCSEGNRTADGGHNASYYGHTDPGNGAHNLGTFSVQGVASVATPEQADAYWLGQLRDKLLPAYLQACALGLQKSDNALLFAAVCDLYTQSPAACTAKGGLLDQVAKPRPVVTEAALVDMRCAAYVDPATGKLEAAGFGNDPARLRADQQRRMDAVAACLKARAML